MSEQSPVYDAAPERELCPGIVVRADTCDGFPRIGETRLRTDAIDSYWRREVAEGHRSGAAVWRVADDYHTSIYSVQHAVSFEAGRRYERERRKARKQKRLGKRWAKGKAAAEGLVDDKG